MVYIDLLIIEDFLLNYVILYAVSILLNRITSFKRIFISSIIGLIPTVLLFINLNNYITNIITIIFSIIMSIISFNYKSILYTIKNALYMYIVSIFLAGSIYLINTNFLPKINNYLVNTLVLIVLAPIITYIYLKFIIKNSLNQSNYYLIDIYLKDKPKITLNAFLDTGNKLIDPYTRKPIILVTKKLIDINDYPILLIPYNTIDNHSLLSCFKPEKIYIHGLGYKHRVLIALINQIGIDGVDCLLNSKLLERI